MLEIYIQELGAAEILVRFLEGLRHRLLGLGNCVLRVLIACRLAGQAEPAA